MTGAMLLAAVAAALGVLAAWDAVVALGDPALGPRLVRVLAPLRLAGAGGRPASALERRRLALVGAATLLAAGWLVAGPFAGLALAAAGPWVVRRALAAREARWRRALAATAPHVARALADALAGGHALRGGLDAAARHGGVPEPGGAELRAAAAALEAGASTEDVLERLRRRADDPGWDTLVAGALLQRDTGGDLARLLRDVATALEDGARARLDARGATAQARATATIVTAMPVGAAVLAELAAPGSLAALAGRPATAALALGAVALQVTGLLVVRRLARTGPAA